MSSRGEWRETKWVYTTHLEPAVASKAASEEPDRFARAVTALERALEVAKSTGDFASVHSRFQPTSQFFSARTGLRPEDLTRCAHVAIEVMHAVDGDVSSQARWGTMATRVMETHGKRLRLSVDWRPLHRLLRAYLDGDSEGYNGAIPLAVHQAVVSRLARKSRRHFAPDAPAQIWAMLEPEIRAVDTADCFEGLGMLNLLMPCARVGDDDDTNPWDEWVGTWVRMSSWMHTNSFWLAAWHAIFAQLAKHDVRGRIDWSKHRAHMHTTSLWFMELPVGGGEGPCPFGRRSPTRATYLFNRFVNEDGMRVRTAAKAMVYRLGTTSEAMVDGKCPDTNAMEAIVDVAETYAHPSNNGRWHQNIALFVQHSVRYFRKRCASKRHVDSAPVFDELKRTFARCMMRLIDPGMYSKNGKFRMVASSCAGQLAYLCPAAVLPKVMTRFQEAIEHSTATHQLAAALSVMTSCLRPMLLAPPEAFAGGGVPPPADYLAAVLDATLPGVDANDSHKTLGTVRLYASVVSNFGALADPGETGACDAFPFFWSDWIPALFDRFFAFFRNVDPGNASKSDGADKHRGGADGDGGASYLMGTSSMYSPLMRLIFARMHPKLRPRAVRQLAQFALTSTHSGLTGEVGQMVMAAATQAPEEAVPNLTVPLLRALAAEMDDVARLVADGVVEAHQIVSPTKEAKLKWLTGLLGSALHKGGPRIVEISSDVSAVLRSMFELSVTGKSLRLAEMAAHLSSMLCGALTGTYIDDLFAADDADQSMPARWVASKVREGESDDLIPSRFNWRRPSPDEIRVATEVDAEFLRAPATLLLDALVGGEGGEGNDPNVGKEKVRGALASIGGVVSGFRTRLEDFQPAGIEPAQIIVGARDVIAVPIPVQSRALACDAVAAVLEKVGADDAETLGMALFVADKLLAPHSQDFHGIKSALRTWHADATALTQPKFAPDDRKVQPRWLVAEYTFLRFLWRGSQAAYHRGGPGADHPSHPSFVRLVEQCRRMCLHKYSSVRAAARCATEGVMKRFPDSIPRLCDPAKEALAAKPADEDRCVAACKLLKATTSVNRLRTDPAHFRSVAAALLGSSHHDAEKAQTAVNELFLSVAIRFSRSHLRHTGDETYELHADLRAARELIFGMMSPTEKDPVAAAAAANKADKKTRVTALHWSYSLMANALLLFLVHPRLDDVEMSRLTSYAMSCLLGDLKVIRMPAACVLLMISRFESFERAGAPVVANVLSSQPGALATIVANLGLCHGVGDGAGGARGPQGRADALVQAAENLYGAGSDMSGKPWPRTRACDDHVLVGSFVVACARLFGLFARVAPRVVCDELEAPLSRLAFADGDRGARCAAAEAIAGVLASSSPPRWAAPLLLRAFDEAANDSTEEWLRAVRYAARGGDTAGGAGCEPLLAALSAPVCQSTATVSQRARRLEAALICVAELAAPPVSDASIAFQESLMDQLLASGESSPLANPSRATREEAAKLAAQLIGAHGGDVEDVAHGVDHERFAGLRAKANALLAQFVECAPDACRESLERQPSDARHLDGDESPLEGDPGDPGVVVMDLDHADPQTKGVATTGQGFTAPEGRGMHWLEGSFLTVIQLAKHGGGANVFGSIAKMLPFVLRVQECPDREFALVAKRTLTYLKYLVFPRRHLAAAVAGTLEGMRDSSQWHARAAGLKFCQAFSYRHSFTLSDGEMAALRDETFDRLRDAQVEVRSLARDTLVGFLKGVGMVSAAAAGVRARCLAAAAELQPRKRRRPPPRGGPSGDRLDPSGGRDTPDEDAKAARHGCVLGLGACVLSAPYDVPEWMPEVLEELSRRANEPNPVKDTVRLAFSEFKKTHQDAWAETRAAFTSEQWETISMGMELAPSYIV